MPNAAAETRGVRMSPGVAAQECPAPTGVGHWDARVLSAGLSRGFRLPCHPNTHYPRIPVVEIPSTIRRWEIRKKMKIGASASDAIANIGPQVEALVESRKSRGPSDTVYFSTLFR